MACDQVPHMRLTFPDGKTFEGDLINQVRHNGIEYVMLVLYPFSRHKFLVVRKVLGTQTYTAQVITGAAPFWQFYEHIKNLDDPVKLIAPLLDEARNNRTLDWKVFYDAHYPEFVYAGLTWSEFRSIAKYRKVA